jgi:hypothetical protein
VPFQFEEAREYGVPEHLQSGKELTARAEVYEIIGKVHKLNAWGVFIEYREI